MPITREQKEQQVKVLSERFAKTKAAVLTDYHGLTVRDIQQLRADLREQNVDYQVAKNSLLKLAAKDAGLDLGELEGPTAIAFGYDDSVTTAKAVNEFAKGNDNLEILGGYIDGDKVDV